MEKNFCPFLQGPCRKECVFWHPAVADGSVCQHCLIANRLNEISEKMSDNEST